MASENATSAPKKGCAFLIFALLGLILVVAIYSYRIESVARTESLKFLKATADLYSQGRLEDSIASASKALSVPNLAPTDSQEAQQKLNALMEVRDSQKTDPLFVNARAALKGGDLDSAIRILDEATLLLRSRQSQDIRTLLQKCKYATTDEGLGDVLAHFTPEEYNTFCTEGRLPEHALTPDVDSDSAFRITLPKAKGKEAELREKGLERIEQKKAADERMRKQQLMSQPIEGLKSITTATVVDKDAVLWEKADTSSKKLAVLPKGASQFVEKTEMVELGGKERKLKQFFHAVQYRGKKGFLGSWVANLQVEFPDCDVMFRAENLTDLIAGNGPTADIVLQGNGIPERAVLDLLGKWSVKNGIVSTSVYLEDSKEEKASRKGQIRRELVCRLEGSKIVTREEVAKEDSEKKAKDETSAAQHKLLKERLDKFMARLNAIQKEDGLSLISNVEVEVLGKSWTAKLTVNNPWHLAHYQLRLQNAQALWNIWASIASPEDPDLARISICDKMGNEVGGSRILGGSLIWVQKE